MTERRPGESIREFIARTVPPMKVALFEQWVARCGFAGCRRYFYGDAAFGGRSKVLQEAFEHLLSIHDLTNDEALAFMPEDGKVP